MLTRIQLQHKRLKAMEAARCARNNLPSLAYSRSSLRSVEFKVPYVVPRLPIEPMSNSIRGNRSRGSLAWIRCVSTKMVAYPYPYLGYLTTSIDYNVISI